MESGAELSSLWNWILSGRPSNLNLGYRPVLENGLPALTPPCRATRESNPFQIWRGPTYSIQEFKDYAIIHK